MLLIILTLSIFFQNSLFSLHERTIDQCEKCWELTDKNQWETGHKMMLWGVFLSGLFAILSLSLPSSLAKNSSTNPEPNNTNSNDQT